MMRKYKTMKSLEDSCDSSVKKANSEESQVTIADICNSRREVWGAPAGVKFLLS